MESGEWGVGVGSGNHRALLVQQPFPTGSSWGAGEHSVKATKLDKSHFQSYRFMAMVLSVL